MAQRSVEQALLEVVARSVDVDTLILLLFTVQRRVDVLPASENNAVKLAGGPARRASGGEQFDLLGLCPYRNESLEVKRLSTLGSLFL